MGRRFCDNRDGDEPHQPDRVVIKCVNCLQKIHDGELDESVSFHWKELENYPEDRSCPDCGDEIHIHPEEVDTYCRSARDGTEHGRFCCDCGTWMIKAQNVDLGGWECPNDSCGIQRLGG